VVSADLIRGMNILVRFLALSSTLVIISGCTKSLTSLLSKSQDTSIQTAPAAVNQPFSYDDYASVLKTYVNEAGLVDYKGLQANRGQLDKFIAAIGAVAPAVYQSWGEKQKLAFLINAYNAFTLQSIIDQNPLKNSIRDIPGVWRWRKFPIAGEFKTLDNIEHDTIRANFNEPRIHLALVCAAISCPPLRNAPYTPEKLDEQLSAQVRRFLASPQGFRLELREARVYLSSIYKWYGSDWEKSYAAPDKFTGNNSERAVLSFLSRYLSPTERNYLEAGNYQINYLNYDWSLNRQ
jgi:hypothetical protein